MSARWLAMSRVVKPFAYSEMTASSNPASRRECLPNHGRLERSSPIPGHVDPHVTDVGAQQPKPHRSARCHQCEPCPKSCSATASRSSP
jgi:hypothetical protein